MSDMGTLQGSGELESLIGLATCPQIEPLWCHLSGWPSGARLGDRRG